MNRPDVATTADLRKPTKQWELRAASRSRGRSTESSGRDFANEIIDAAWALVQDDNNLDFTVKQVIARAGVALQTFYRYFGNKDELLLAMFEESMQYAAEAAGAVAAGTPIETLRRIVTGPIVMEFDEQLERITRWRGRERQRLLEFFPEAVEAVYEPYRAAIASAIVAVCDSGQGWSDAPELDAKLILHLVQEMSHGVHGGGIDDPAEQVAARVWHMVSAAIGMAATTPMSR
jgi:TetR/AcrR family transcriptional regulator